MVNPRDIAENAKEGEEEEEEEEEEKKKKKKKKRKKKKKQDNVSTETPQHTYKSIVIGTLKHSCRHTDIVHKAHSNTKVMQHHINHTEIIQWAYFYITAHVLKHHSGYTETPQQSHANITECT